MTDPTGLVEIYLDGFVSGIASLAMTLSEGDSEKSERIAQSMGMRLQQDAAAMEEVIRQIATRLAGDVDGPPVGLRI